MNEEKNSNLKKLINFALVLTLPEEEEQALVEVITKEFPTAIIRYRTRAPMGERIRIERTEAE